MNHAAEDKPFFEPATARPRRCDPAPLCDAIAADLVANTPRSHTSFARLISATAIASFTPRFSPPDV